MTPDERYLEEVSDYEAQHAYEQHIEQQARNAVWDAYMQRVAEARGATAIVNFKLEVGGELVEVPLLPPEAEKAAAEDLLQREGEPDVQGDEDGAEFVWDADPLEALARVRPRLVGAVLGAHRAPALKRACRPQRRARARRFRRVVRRTVRTTSSRGDPDDPEPGGAGPVTPRAAR